MIKLTSWRNDFLDLAQWWANKSKDPSTKVGAVIVDDLRRVVGTGYNGFARGVKDSPERYADRELKYKLVVHAEINAILNAVKDVHGCTLYTTFFPCPRCASIIVQSGIKKIVARANPADARYVEESKLSITIFKEGNVDWIITQDLSNEIDVGGGAGGGVIWVKGNKVSPFGNVVDDGSWPKNGND